MVDKWTNPTTANLRGENSLPLQQTFSSLSTYLGKLDDAITTAAGAGVLSLTGTASQITVSASTGNITLSIPSSPTLAGTVTAGGFSAVGTMTLNRASATAWNAGANIRLQIDGTTYSTIGVNANSRVQFSGGLDIASVSYVNAGNSSYIEFGPNASWGAYLRVGSTPNVSGTSIAQVISTDGNLHLDSGANNNIYLNYYSAGRPINVYGQMNCSYNIVLGSHTLSSDTWRFRVTPNNYTSLWIDIGEYYARSAVRGGTGLYLIGSGDIWFGIETNNRMGYWNTAGIYLEQGWIRPHGDAGIYFQSYGGGFHMTDSTWIRTYNGKNLYCSAEIRSNYPFSSNNTNNGANLRMISGNLTYFGWYGYYAIHVDSTHVKTFVIDHPTKQDNYLVHACAEGPTSDVFYRGEAELKNGICVVELPEYFEELTEQHGRTVMVTPIADENGPAANLAAYEIENGQFVVEQIGGFHVPYQRFWWRVDAIRKNTSFNVEPSKQTHEVVGDGPYTYLRQRSA